MTTPSPSVAAAAAAPTGLRILTFNVNSLHRLLNHPLHHILKNPSNLHRAPTENGTGTTDPDEEEEERQLAAELAQEDQSQADSPPGGGVSSFASDFLFASSAASVSVSSTVPRPQPRSQLELDAEEQSVLQAKAERVAHSTTYTSPSSSSMLLTRLLSLLNGLQADIICFQEVKLSRAKMTAELAIIEGYDAFYSFSKRRQGYSGVVTYCKHAKACPLKAEEGFTGMLSSGAGNPLNNASSSIQPSKTSIGEYSQLFSEFDSSALKELDR